MKYTKDALHEISFPLGGIGTGSIGLAGNGMLIDWEIFGSPDKGTINGNTFFAIRAVCADGQTVTRALQGDMEKNLSGAFSRGRFHGFGFGPDQNTLCGLPHFREVTFDGMFPIARLRFADGHFPGQVVMTAWNPMIPLDSENSSLPVALFDITVENAPEGTVYEVIFSVTNPFDRSVNRVLLHEGCTAVRLSDATLTPDCRDYGDMTVSVDRAGGIVQEYWYRGEWRDHVSTFWHELSTGTMGERHYDTPGKRDVCSVGASLVSGETLRFTLAWNHPNCYNSWDPCLDGEGKDILWKNYYATRFADSEATALYVLRHRAALYEGTRTFCDSLHSSTLDPAVVDAISSTMSVLKSPTVLRLENGAFYGWEGVHARHGSCEGTCTHVWSYAYALCFLYPDLERSIRETEFRYDVCEDGKMGFRTMLPLGRSVSRFRACVDGQMLTVVKTYREWKLGAGDEWLRIHFDTVKKLLAYAWSEENPDEWDRDRDGVLEGRQHHTLDMELFGPSSWLEGLYLAALRAASEMAAYLGETEMAEEYRALFESGYAYMRENLFNGSYFIQKVDLTDKTPTEHFDCPNYWNAEKGQLKYQIADGSEIDQMLGQWHANLLGLGDIFDRDQRRTALCSMMKHNFKSSMREFANVWRVFALNDEGGTVICDYPEGCEKPVIPIPYCEECMTGFEYAFAGLLISEGYVEEGLCAVRAIRDRYDGKKRNPWNEIECGSNYARAMASFALLPIFSGFTFDIPHGRIGFAPITAGDFRAFFSAGTGWGDFIRTDGADELRLHGGTLPIGTLTLGGGKAADTLEIDGVRVPFTQTGADICFDCQTVKRSVRVIYRA